MFELLPLSSALQTAPAVPKLPPFKEDRLEQYYDDLRAAQTRIKLYEESNVDEDDEVSHFSEEISEVMDKFVEAINLIGSSGGLDNMIDACFDAYNKAIGGRKGSGKFCRKWQQILLTKKPIAPTTNITLPNGKPLTVVLLGKTGNGKSSAGNLILGKELFGASDGAQSETVTCAKQKRTEEREITVIDTPGVMDTATVKEMTSKRGKAKYLAGFRDVQEQTLKELARMVLYAPRGFDAILLVAKFGSRFTRDDNDALTMLTKFLGEDAKKYMILLFTHGDDAEFNARKKRIPVDEYMKTWIDGMVEWMKRFIHSDLEDRVALFNCRVMPDEEPEAYKKQLCKVIEMIDKIAEKQEAPFKTEFIDSNLEDVLDSVAPEDKKKVEEEKVNEIKDKIKENNEGCYPASATFVDVSGRRRKMESLLLGEEVQVITNESITSEPVITFIHRQPDLFQKFMQITTLRYKKILKITEDHLIFVEKNGKESVIPARDVKIGDIVYVKGGQEMPEKDAVQCVSIVFEKGVYAPVTLSGTILVNDVHTSCYFDVLSHVWFHRAMGAARAVYHLSPRMVEWISSIGEEDGFPGWCRLAHKLLLTWNDST